MTDETTQWDGPGWSVRREPGAAAPISVQVEQSLDPAAARALGTAIKHAAWCADQQPALEDWTHAYLTAILVQAGGNIDLPVAAMESDALGGADGQHYGYEVRLTDAGALRVSVTPAPDEG